MNANTFVHVHVHVHVYVLGCLQIYLVAGVSADVEGQGAQEEVLAYYAQKWALDFR
jgi:hypothetical protein